MIREGTVMKKSYRLEDLDCANCAAKMERAVAGIAGVNRVTISFMAQKMVLDAADDRFEAILDEAEACIKKVDANCRVIRK